jgi:hypothetical protein
MGTNLNQHPYYDDYNAAKGFYRILFKPSYAVQARELTQLQTILQEQIRRFGNHIFKDGSVVFGCAESFNFDFPYVKILDNLVSGGAITDLAQYKGAILEGVTTGVRAVVKDVADGVETDPVNLKTLFVQYIYAGGSGADAGKLHKFEAGEILRLGVGGANTFTVAAADKTPTGSASFFSIDDGIIYVDGTFVLHTNQSVLLDRYSTTPSKRVGFTLVSDAVTHQSDATLLDPARGSYNFAAPGADRLRLTTQLEARELDAPDDPNFFLLFEVEEGVTKRKYNKTTYAELRKELARRTYDESGNYTVRPFSIVVREHLKTLTNNGKYTNGDATKLAVGVEPGKAYVSGFEYETFTTEYVAVNKGTDTQKVLGQIVSTNYGSFVNVSSVSGPWSLNTGQSVNLLNGSAQTIGTARVRSLMFISGSGTIGTSDAKYRLYLYDIKFTDDPSTWRSVAGTGVAADIVLVNGSPIVYNKDKDAMLFSLPYPAVKTLRPNNSPDIDYVYKKVVTASMVNGQFTITLPAGEQWPFSVIDSLVTDNIYVCTTGTLGALTTGQVLDTTDNVTYVSPTSLSFNMGSYTGTVGVSIIVPVKRSANTSIRTKGKWTRCIKINTQTHANTDTGTYSLGVPDAYAIAHVWMAENTQPFTATPQSNGAWTEVTDNFTLVQNDKDTHYDTSYIVSDGTLTLTNKKLIVEFTYFAHGVGSFFSVDSYPVNDTNPASNEILTQDIPKYTSATGVVFDLRNTLDFRPSVAATVTPQDRSSISDNATALNPAAGTSIATSGLADPDPFYTLEADLEFYLGRIDKIALTEEGKFISVKGMPSMKPEIPADVPTAMSLAILTIPPYPSLSPYVARQAGKTEDEVKVKLIDNRRYTMADIGQIANRVSKLEYNTKISGLEQEAINTPIISATGQNRFKNGILVDSFTGHNVGNVLSAEHNCAVDPKLGEMRPSFEIDCVKLETITNGLNGLVQTGDLITLPFTHKLYSRNPFASKPRNVVSAILFNYEGQITLDPPQDMWTDTSVQPDVQVNIDGNADNWQAQDNAWGTEWGSWETFWIGGEVQSDQNGPTTTITETVTERQRRTGTQTSVTSESITQQLGNRVVSAAIVPFMRSIAVRFRADNLKPNTRVYAFFDSEDVNANCKPQTNGVDTTGATYGAAGAALITDSFGRVAGQFTIPAGKFRVGTKAFILTDDPFNRGAWSSTYAVELFTASGLQLATQGTTVSTRVPRVTINTITETRDLVSTRQTQVTEVFVPPPILIEDPPPDPEMVEIIRGRRPNDPIAQTFVVANNPGGMFLTKLDLYFRTKSATAPITVQIREVINGYPSETIVPFGTATLLPSAINISENGSAATTFSFPSPVYLKGDTEYCFVVLPAGNSADYTLWVSELGQVDIASGHRISEQAAAGVLFVSSNNRTWTALQSEDIKFSLYQAEFDIASPGTVVFKNEDVGSDVLVNAITPVLTTLNFATTTADWEYQVYTSDGTPPTGYAAIAPSDTMELAGEFAILSGNYPTGTLNIRGTVASTVANLSPAIDAKKVACVVTSNNVTTDPATTSKYVSRAMPLELEAEDLQVILSQKLTGASTVEVYAKIQSALDSRNFDDLPWVKMTTNQVVLRGGYSSYTYVLPAYNASTPTVPGLNTSGVVQYSHGVIPMTGVKKFAVKIAFLSGNTWEVPRVKDLKAIALMA